MIDFGEWFLPKSWDELKLKQYQEIERYYSDKETKFDVRDVLHIMCGRSIDEIGQLPIDFVDKMLNELVWLQEKPQWGERTNKVEIDGEMYIVNVHEKMKTGEYIAVDTVLKADKCNYAAIMAILCRREGEIFDSKFENEVLGDRIEMWENVSVLKVMPIISFFFECWLVSQKSIRLSSMVEEAINLTRMDIENLHKDGGLSALSTTLLKRKLKKLKKSIKHI